MKGKRKEAWKWWGDPESQVSQDQAQVDSGTPLHRTPEKEDYEVYHNMESQDMSNKMTDEQLHEQLIREMRKNAGLKAESDEQVGTQSPLSNTGHSNEPALMSGELYDRDHGRQTVKESRDLIDQMYSNIVKAEGEMLTESQDEEQDGPMLRKQDESEQQDEEQQVDEAPVYETLSDFDLSEEELDEYGARPNPGHGMDPATMSQLLKHQEHPRSAAHSAGEEDPEDDDEMPASLSGPESSPEDEEKMARHRALAKFAAGGGGRQGYRDTDESRGGSKYPFLQTLLSDEENVQEKGVPLGMLKRDGMRSALNLAFRNIRRRKQHGANAPRSLMKTVY